MSKDFYVIGVGTSAGGLEALKLFFDHVPADCPHSFVVIQHLSPDHKSLMADLLAKNTQLTIHEVKDGMVIEGGAIYLLPPRMNISIENNVLYLKEKDTRSLNLPIDIFFRSLAEDQGERAIGVILTGSGSDGTRGVRAIKEAGGMVMVQEPTQAKFDGMPLSAIHTGLVDFVLQIEQMPEELFTFIENPSSKDAMIHQLDEDKQTADKILSQVKQLVGLDFSMYKRATLLRRIARRMNVNKVSDLGGYLDVLFEKEREVNILANEFLIGVTKFFRDEGMWHILREQLIPGLVQKKNPKDGLLKGWIVGCSTGEEAYSLAILIAEELERQGRELQVRIFATDIDTHSLEYASRGVYPASIVADVSPERLERFFVPRGDKYQVIDAIRRMVVFSRHNILSETPLSRMDIVQCRNLLIYIRPVFQRKILHSLHYALNPGGFLVLGSSETIGGHNVSLREIHRKERIFQNVEPIRKLERGGLSFSPVVVEPSVERQGSPRLVEERRILESVNESVAKELQVAAVLVDEQFQIKHVVGSFRHFAQFPEQGFSTNLLKLLPAKLATTVRTALYKAKHTGKQISYAHVSVESDEKVMSFHMMVTPHETIMGVAPHAFLVIFVPKAVRQEALEQSPEQSDEVLQQRVAVLEAELEDSRLSLQATIEQIESSNEEMQVSNEELLATNEELQSTNEELQSVNEELYTVNHEYQLKLDELEQLHIELDNLMKSTHIGTLFLDLHMRIRMITPSIQRQFNLQESDIGRPIYHFTSVFEDEVSGDILKKCELVLRKGQSFHTEVCSKEQSWFLLQIDPYHNYQREVRGVVLSFVDISERKRMEQALKESERRLEEAQLIARMGSTTWDVKSGKIEWSKGMYRLLGYEPEEDIDIDRVYAEMHQTPDEERIQEWLQKCMAAKDGKLTPFEYRVRRKDGTVIYVVTEGNIFYDHEGEAVRVFATVRDIDARKRAESERRKSEAVLGTLAESLPTVFTLLDPQGTVMYVNRLVEGIAFDDYLGSSIYDWLPPDLGMQVREHIGTVSQTRQSVLYDNAYATPLGERKEYYHIMSPVMVGDEFSGVCVLSQEVSELSLLEEEVRNKLEHNNKELEQFAYIVAHDLQQPLRNLTSLTEVIFEDYREGLSEDVTKLLDIIIQSASNMSRMIKGLLDYSLIGREREIGAVDCTLLLEEVEEGLRYQIDQARATLKIGTMPHVVGVSAELYQLFQNLITNAIKYRKRDVDLTIHISAKKNEGVWLFSVEDNGIGIKQEFKERIFQLFQRLHTKKEYEGLGIGLANCRKIVELHKGKIWVESTPGKGSTFYFTLPIVPSRYFQQSEREVL
ncbi:MAG: histidine kinase [Deltaproteobacteria bacterium]|nr:histidine kinase [Deltaproteobacteria bacterium]MBU54568.1 histidine kinase [Deltaproteobacteria bacterium]